MKPFPLLISSIAGALLLCVSLHAWTNKDTDSTLPPGCQHIIYTNQYLTGQYAVKGHFNIYLPPNYSTDTAHYPILYHLHGSTNTAWTDLPMAYLLDSLIRAGRIRPMIQIWTDITYSGWYYDRGNGDNEESYFIKGLVPHIDSLYRTSRRRAISGFSMGGAGALTFAFKYARQPLFSGVIDFDGAFNDITGSAGFDANSPPTLRILADSAAAIRNAKLLIRSWAEGLDFGGYILKAHRSLDSILTARMIPHFYTALNVHHVMVLGEFTTDQSKPRKMLDPSRIIESYLRLDSMFNYQAAVASRQQPPRATQCPFAPYRLELVTSQTVNSAVLYDLGGRMLRQRPPRTLGVFIVSTAVTGPRR
jgi:enterochelin esterase-like enzyme